MTKQDSWKDIIKDIEGSRTDKIWIFFGEIYNKILNIIFTEIPKCAYTGNSFEDTEGDCGYGDLIECDNCICLYFEHGIRAGFDPRTGEKFKKYRMSIFKTIRRIWCYQYEWWEETSIFDPKGFWKGPDYKARKYKALIPFWIRSDDKIENYLDKHSGEDWLYIK